MAANSETAQLTGNEVLEIEPHENVRAITLEQFVYGIVGLYEEYVYCEGFRNNKDQKKFEKKAYEFVTGVLNVR